MKCIYKAPNNFCLKHSTEGTIEFCVEGPCPDEVMAEELDRQYHDFRRGVSDWTQYVRELKAYNAELAGMVIEYLDDIIPGYRKRAEKAEAQLSQYTASGLEPCDYTAMRSAIDGEKEARQSLELPCKVGDRLRLEARGTCYYTVTSLLVLVTQQETRIVIDVLDDAGNSDYFFSESIGKTVFRVDRGQRQKEEV